ncbi:glycosyltransferase family 2 protein [Oryzomonas rubra]|uniref:Glycosyltransferase family 2 protein n=2 Tax=Oryzomonas rubra TaxID=2509454 RepID=A0A5A9XFL7_9BACT|nr:glycosyltransferase family 2 protein [Oryzomonas rubra]
MRYEDRCMNITVMLATYKRNEILSRTLDSFCNIITDGLSWEIFVVDNYGDPKTEQIVLGFNNKLPIRYLVEKKRGKNNALNKAVKLATGDLFVFTDDDVIADHNWLMEMRDGSMRWPDVSVFGGRILPQYPPETKSPISEAHKFFKGAYVVVNWDTGEGHCPPHKIWGPNMAIRSNIFLEGWQFNPDIGPNGDNYIMGSETELLMKLEESGMNAVFLPNALVYHQIRREQLEVAWLYGRAFRYGRSMAQLYELPNATYWFNAPRYLFRKLFETAMRRIIYCYDYDKRIDLGINYWILRGNIYQYRKRAKQECLDVGK